MPDLEPHWRNRFFRCVAPCRLAGLLAGSPRRARLDPFRDRSRIAGLNELLAAFDFEPAAFAHVPRDVYDLVMGSGADESTFRRSSKCCKSETARDMVLCGKPKLAAIDRGLVKIHRR